MNRREWIFQSGLYSAFALNPLGILSALRNISGSENSETPHLLLVSGWQTVNIGDIAHTPGLIHLLYTLLSEVLITLWPHEIEHEEEQMLIKNFPSLRILYSDFDQQGLPENEEIKRAMDQADIMLHGSGPGIIGFEYLQAWRKLHSKPYGIFGVTVGNVWEGLHEVLNEAAFIFTRETHSLEVLQQADIEKPLQGFAPDATFFLPIRDEEAAKNYMIPRGIEDQKFICIVPRLRYSPYHRIHTKTVWDRSKIDQVIEENLKYVEKDHAKLREVIVRWVRETGNNVVLCPEMSYQTELFEPYLYNPLPDDIKNHVYMHPYWQPGAAASLYARAVCVVSAECHSPIISLVNGTPAFYVRQPTDTIKGQMYYDLKLDDWIFEIEETEGQEIADSLMNVYQNQDQSKQIIADLQQRVRVIYQEKVDEIKSLIEETSE